MIRSGYLFWAIRCITCAFPFSNLRGVVDLVNIEYPKFYLFDVNFG